ncbi:MAG: Bax inhibitor-1 family protein [Planctomycetaceae bacterium]|nr:Bax inhibitor-1 family protein [Planctomycetaceae bacterium]
MQNRQPPTPSHAYDTDFNAPTDLFAAAAEADARAGFIMKTYLYLFCSIALLVAIETAIFAAVGAENMVRMVSGVLGTSQFSWLVVLGLFMVVSWVANMWAQNSTSSAIQHAGLGLYIAAMSIILIPLLSLAGTAVIMSAATTTAGLFAMLTLAVFITRKDFSFMRTFLIFGGLAALGLIGTSIVFQFSLGPIFTYAMIAFMCCYILYDTSNVMHHYRTSQHVAAALALFASVVMLFWYILQLFLNRE